LGCPGRKEERNNKRADKFRKGREQKWYINNIIIN
jgi:hypothetical protein